MALLEARGQRAAERLAGLARLHRQLSPDAPLARGYARVSAPGHALVASRAAAAREARLTLHFHDGTLDVATGTTPASAQAAPRAPPRPRPPASEQPKLL